MAFYVFSKKFMLTSEKKQQVEFGDFQTPPALAQQICQFLYSQGLRPASILEPTCGKGSLLVAALESFGPIQKALGIDINPDYVQQAEHALTGYSDLYDANAVLGNFFYMDWTTLFSQLPDPILIIGNPPWVTNAEVGTLSGQNLPAKSNFQQFSGLDAITGKSNFDISEWMLLHLLQQTKSHQATLAMLCKTSVARKVLTHTWKSHLPMADAAIYRIDAKKFFNVSVDACLLVCRMQSPGASPNICNIYHSLDKSTYQTTFGLVDNRLVANHNLYQQWQHLRGESAYQWRSGIKHDCARVMEFTQEASGYRNGLGELCDLENDYLYPLLKSSDVANATHPRPTRWMLVTQPAVGTDTHTIRLEAPKTWAYLNRHSRLLDDRKSVIYKTQARFAIFGVGDYSFAPWKVAISSLYKKLHFAVIAPYAGKPVVLDDTCYSIACATQAEAEHLATLLNSDIAAQFFSALIFWDNKRPITVEILHQLDIVAIAKELGGLEQLIRLTSVPVCADEEAQQLSLFG